MGEKKFMKSRFPDGVRPPVEGVLVIDKPTGISSYDVVRVVKKLDESAPHSVLLVLDATTGQNAVSQAQAFLDIAGVTGIIMTKLDGTARGGILVAIAEKFAYEKRLIVKELARYSIQSILTTPQNLSVNTINKYLELKARGLI